MTVQPLICNPIYKPKLWGGTRIFTHWSRPVIFDEPIGESWELADLEEDQSRVINGPAAGRTITELIPEWGRGLMGDVELFEGRFPLLIKFLDACESLSVQVHPNEKMARRLGGNVRVKHEAWYILNTEPGGFIFHGLEPGVTAGRFREASLGGEVEGVLRRIEVRPGDCYHLPSGTPHALGEGVLVAEVQTPSDITYRTYDWGRVDPRTGLPRELNLDQALECIDFDEPAPPPVQEPSPGTSLWPNATRLTTCPSFHIERVQAPVGSHRELRCGQPVVWIVLSGGGTITRAADPEATTFKPGDTIVLPAGLTDASARLTSDSQWLEVTVPAGA